MLIAPGQELLDLVGVARDVTDAAAEFVGVNFGSRVVLDNDEVRSPSTSRTAMLPCCCTALRRRADSKCSV